MTDERLGQTFLSNSPIPQPSPSYFGKNGYMTQISQIKPPPGLSSLAGAEKRRGSPPATVKQETRDPWKMPTCQDAATH